MRKEPTEQRDKKLQLLQIVHSPQKLMFHCITLVCKRVNIVL